MTPLEPDRPELSSEDAAFVEQLRQTYRWPERSGARRAAFRSRIDERLAQRGRGWRGLLVPVALTAAAAAALVVWLALPPGSEPDAGAPLVATTQPASETPEDAILALTEPGSEIDRNSSLPEDYEAISSLLLGGV